MSTKVASDRPRWAGAGTAPKFTVRTDRDFAVVQVATDPILLDDALHARRSPANFVELPETPVRRGRASFTLPAAQWRVFAVYNYLYYRGIGYKRRPPPAAPAIDPASVEKTTADHDFARAPSIYVTRPPLPPARRRLSGTLPWLRVDGNRLVDEKGNDVLLRGVNRSGMQYSGRSRAGGSRATAGITRANVREIVTYWDANIIRLPLNQEWALTRPDYLVEIDSVVEWAAAAGAYTLLCLHWFDIRHRFSVDPDLPPIPDENSIRFWQLLASRYRREAAVLYDIFNEPHVDASAGFPAPPNRPGWIALWHDWARRIEAAIHAVHERATLFVSGWEWGLSLREMPIGMPQGGTLPNTVYSTHVYYDASTGPPAPTSTTAGFEYWFGFERLRSQYPIFVGEWGGRFPAGVGVSVRRSWGLGLEAYMRERHRYSGGLWQGLCGWTAWSWGDEPHLVERSPAPGRAYTVDPLGHNVPTAFGRIVFDALHDFAAPFSTSTYPPMMSRDAARTTALGQAIAAERAALPASSRPLLDRACFAIAKLDGAGATVGYAGVREEEMLFSASLLKVAILYASFELHERARAFARNATASSPAEVPKLLAKAFDPRVRESISRIPDDARRVVKYGEILAASAVGGGFAIDFRSQYLSDLKKTFSDQGQNVTPKNCILKLGFSYINGALANGGFLDLATRKGIWLGGTFGGVWDSVPFPTSGGGASSQCMTALAMARLLASMQRGELVSAQASAEMIDILQPVSWLTGFPGTAATLSYTIPRAKVGHALSLYSEGGIADRNGTRFAFAWQNLRDSLSIEMVYRIMDEVIRNWP